MEWTLKFRENENLLFVYTKGAFNIKDFEKMVEEIIEDEKWIPGMDVIFNHTKLDLSEITPIDFSNAITLHKNYDKEIGNGKTALVMKGDAGFGIGRQYQNMAHKKVLSEIKVFRNEKEAYEWVLSE